MRTMMIAVVRATFRCLRRLAITWIFELEGGVANAAAGICPGGRRAAGGDALDIVAIAISHLPWRARRMLTRDWSARECSRTWPYCVEERR